MDISGWKYCRNKRVVSIMWLLHIHISSCSLGLDEILSCSRCKSHKFCRINYCTLQEERRQVTLQMLTQRSKNDPPNAGRWSMWVSCRNIKGPASLSSTRARSLLADFSLSAASLRSVSPRVAPRCSSRMFPQLTCSSGLTYPSTWSCLANALAVWIFNPQKNTLLKMKSSKNLVGGM